jgi:tetratricopeptide (TPR) repeat protein
MALHWNNENKHDIQQLLVNYRNLREGRSHQFIDEENFEIIIRYYDEREQYEKSLQAANFAVDQFPYSSALLIKKADLLIAIGKYKNALKILEQAELLDNSDFNLYILKTDAYLATDQQDKAIDLLESVLSQFNGKEKIELLFELADVYDDYENFDKVFDCLVHILEIQPTNEEALYKICFWADHTGRNEESIKIHLNIINEFPYCELGWFNLGSAYQGIKLYEKAIDAYQYVLVIDEKFDFAYRNIGDAYMRLRKYKEAIENLLKVLEIAKPEEVIFEALAYCYEKLKLPAEARFYYKKASHLNPENANLYYKMACTYMQQEQWKNAVKLLDNANKLTRLHPTFNYAMAQCYFQLEDYNQCIFYLSNTIAAKPATTKAWELLMICMYATESFDDGIGLIDKALEATNHKTLFLYYKVAFLQAKGKLKQAILLLDTALTLAPKQLKILIELNPTLLHHNAFVDCIVKHKIKR